MQTFLPFPDFKLSAESLDRQRLCKQRVECKQIFNSLRVGAGWKNHPAVKMWRGHESSLLDYAIAICMEWQMRGYNDSLLWEFLDLQTDIRRTEKPSWLGLDYVHRSHRSNLIRKLPSHYRTLLGWSEPDDLPYFWPV